MTQWDVFPVAAWCAKRQLVFSAHVRLHRMCSSGGPYGRRWHCVQHV